MDRAEVERWRTWIAEKTAPGTPISVAIEREEWELAAMHLILTAIEIQDQLGPQAMEALLDELEMVPHRGSRARKKRGAHGRPA
jgi:hypothetical protein